MSDERQRHERMQEAQRRAYDYAEQSEDAPPTTLHLLALRSAMWARVAMALRRDTV